jgi:aminoglycoside phosphotransferase family enzyme
VHAPAPICDAAVPSLAEKVAFLGRSDAYPHAPAEVQARETHMSWVFLAGALAYKLKKPVRFPFLDFSTVERREAACRAELALNHRLAADVYLDVVPLTAGSVGLAVGGSGAVVDWLVVMRRLDENRTLERAIRSGSLKRARLDEVISVLAQFYRTTRRVFVAADVHLAGWRRNVELNRRVLLDARFRLPAGLIRYIDRVQRRFLTECGDLLRERASGRQIVDGHGDLRPEHIWLGSVRIIDCLEFNPSLRAVDPIDEVAFLSLECERLGGDWAAEYIHRRMMRALRIALDDPLFMFYRCYRATLRARLAIAHLLEPNPRSPEKWPLLAWTYLRLAQVDARRIERALRTRRDRSAAGRRAGDGWPRRKGAPRTGRRACRARCQDRSGRPELYR